MKAIIFSALMLLVVNQASAIHDDYRLTSYGHNLILNTTSWGNSEIKISIQDDQGQILLYKKYSPAQAQLAKKFNLTALRPGQYHMVISTADKSIKQKFTMLKEEIFISPEAETYVKPQFELNGELLKVNIAQFGKTAKLKLLDPANQVVYESAIGKTGYNKLLNLSKLGKGEYSIQVIDGKDQYTHSFELK